MRRKDEQVVGKRLELRDRGQPVAERVRFGLAEAERYVGRDTRQHLVAGDHQPSRLFDQAGMLGAMATADDHPPVTIADAECVALPHAHEAYRRSEEHTSELQSLMRISYAVFCLK